MGTRAAFMCHSVYHASSRAPERAVDAIDSLATIREARTMSNIVPFSILSAVTVLDSTASDWSLLEIPADGPRRHRHKVTFEHPFATPPVVHVGIAALDVSKDDNVRVRVRALDITAAGFILEAETWLNTKIWAVDVSWLAIGAS